MANFEQIDLKMAKKIQKFIIFVLSRFGPQIFRWIVEFLWSSDQDLNYLSIFGPVLPLFVTPGGFVEENDLVHLIVLG